MLVLNPVLDPELGVLRLPAAEGRYHDNAEIMVSDRHRNKWFGRPLKAWCAGDAAAAWITTFLHKRDSRLGTTGPWGQCCTKKKPV